MLASFSLNLSVTNTTNFSSVHFFTNIDVTYQTWAATDIGLIPHFRYGQSLCPPNFSPNSFRWSIRGSLIKVIIVSAKKVSLAMVEHVIKCLNAVRLFILTVRVRIIINMISSVLIRMIITNTKLTRARVTPTITGLGG